MAGNGREVMGVTVHGSGSLRLACAGVLEHALRLLNEHDHTSPYVRVDVRRDPRPQGGQTGDTPRH